MLINNIITIATEAAEIARDAFGKQFLVEFKTNESNLVTEIDKKCEKHITEFITKAYPGHNIVAEESGDRKIRSEYEWFVDPIDGTTNFAHAFPVFSVSIGVRRNGQIIAGAVYDVMNKNCYAAELGGGSYRNETKLSVSAVNKLSLSLLVSGFPYNVSENPFNILDTFVAMTRASQGMRRLGSAALDFCYVAQGAFDGFWEGTLNPWDMCAGYLIATEAGGKVTNYLNSGFELYTQNVLCSNGLIHDEMRAIIERTFKP